ncbi:xylanase inhibitor protein 2-like [Oryza sativa Japonica Group]|uniref:Xylanase inhibitor protein 2, putative, expressed n=4 Tax=Oryza sativa TaxID=4530 RepID=Q2QZ61_ORYSJ|nr:xylanase inhibitor protein 2-like [Oryza sativa Japonica Group]ABA95480.1 Xylanase inhibitor protein 2 precursor, putative, expressed [Oryza sativa Japonica Group]
MMGLLSLLLVVVSCLAAPATADWYGPLAVYWGRHKDYEGSLREACDTGRYNTVIITFYSVFGYVKGRYGLDISGHPVAAVGADIKHCQSKGVQVLLSIGGQGGGYSLPSSQSAADVADNLWNAYLGGRRAGVPRPFGDAAVDGIDFFIDQGGADHYDELARQLHGRGVALTATVRCSYPDSRLQKALATGLLGRIHVRIFGDNQCTMLPLDAWEKWAAAYPRSKVWLALVASWEQDEVGYMFQKDLYYGVLQFILNKPNYGGIAIWDRYYDKKANYSGEG